MNTVNLITKKADKKELTREEIEFLVSFYMSGNMPDYQMSSLLMAIKLNGMTKEETVNYTRALLESGETIDLHEDWVDKHSTGGVGDKTTIALMPILAAMGVNSFKISGRGLGHTGGTVDKLESIKGLDIELDIDKAIEQTNTIGLSVTGQTPNLTPADKAIYALRDVSGTVASIPLIAASIMSKKIASGSKYILIDLKVGSGAFMKNIDEAKELGKVMKEIGESFGRKVFILFSRMEQPLGQYIGNGCEVYEAVKLVENRLDNDFTQLVKKIASEIYSEAKSVSIEEASNKFDEVIKNGEAKSKFVEWITNQGADVEYFNSRCYFRPEYRYVLRANMNGYIKMAGAEEFGKMLIELGAGRKVKEDKLDYQSGMKIEAKNNEEIELYAPMVTIYSSTEVSEDMLQKITQLFVIEENPSDNEELIIDELRW